MLERDKKEYRPSWSLVSTYERTSSPGTSLAPDTRMSCMEYAGRYEAQLAPYAAASRTTTAASAPITRKRLRRVRSLSGDGDDRRGGSLNENGRVCAPGFLLRRSTIARDDIFAHVAPERLGNGYRTICLLVVLDDLAEDTRCRERGVVERVYVAHHSIFAAVADVQSSRLKVMKIRGRMRLAIRFLARHPGLDVVFFHLSQTQVAAAVDDDVVRKPEHLQEFLRVLGQFLVPLNGFFVARFAQDDLLVLQKFVDAKPSLRVFAVPPRLSSETRGEGNELQRQVFFFQYLVHVVSHRCDLGCSREVVAVLCFIEIFLALRKISGAD